MTEIESLSQQLLEEKLRCDEYMEDNQLFATQYNKVVEAISTYAGNLEKQVVMLRDALAKLAIHEVYESDVADFASEALAATDDLSGYILCEREPVGHGLFDTDGKCYTIGQHRSSMHVDGKAFKSEPLYRAKEQGK